MPASPLRQIFLSSVTAEFGEHRVLLKSDLGLPRVKVQEQADFTQDGGKLLQTLDKYIRNHCDAVIHLVGGQPGETLKPDEVRWLRKTYADFPERFPFLEADLQALPPTLTYTQMEAWLALYHGRRVHLYRPSGMEEHPLPNDHPQRVHWQRLKTLGEHRSTFDDKQHLCRRVLRDLHQLFPQDFPTPLARLIYPPLGRLFIGRETFVQDLRTRFQQARSNGHWPIHAVCGLGGVGKTRLAVEYAWLYQDHYEAVLMVNAESPESLDRELATLSGVLYENLDPHLSDPQRLQATREWLQRHPGWLLLVDNVDTEHAREAVAGRLSYWTAGHVLITGRVASWPREVERLDLHVLSGADGQRFLLEATDGRRAVKTHDQEQALALAEDDLGGLCLALEQAAAYIGELNISLDEYRRRWQKNEKRVRQWSDKLLMRYHQEKEVSLSVATTWQTTIDQLDPASRCLLEMLSWLAPAPLPRGLLDHPELQTQLRTVADDEQADVELALAQLRRYSLISRADDAEFDAIGQIHRLVQLLTRDQLADPERSIILTAMLAAINKYTPTDSFDVRTWLVLEPLQTHLAAIIEFADRASIAIPTTRLMNDLGLLLQTKANYVEAEPLLNRAVDLGKAHFGEEHVAVAIYLNNLASLLQATNRLAEAEPLMRRALAINEQAYGAYHPDVAIQLSNLALLLQATNRLTEAEPMMRRALDIEKQSSGNEHANVATYLSNLAVLLQDTNRLKEAEPLMRRALGIHEQSCGAEHPRVAIDLNNLAQLLKDTNRLEEAEPLMRRALAIDEQSYGAEHPKVAIRLNNLAQLLEAKNRPTEAERLMRSALAIGEKSLGPEHAWVANPLNNLAMMLQAANRLAEAEPLMRRAVAIFGDSLGDEHPSTKTVTRNLELLLEAREQAQAEE